MHRLYLAGPDVFRPDPLEHGRRLTALCAAHGFEGIFPYTAQLPAHLQAPREQAEHIYRINIAHIEACDAVLANLDFFRGPEPDSGTCFEVGYAVARGKPVVGYVAEAGSFAQRIRQRYPHAVAPGGTVDTSGWSLEEFGLPLNLMLAVPARIAVGGLEAALAMLRQEYGRVL
ncbi:nucleoside 2-deoxyribosyltransferase [Caenimonas sedimenti]|uniref:nucleoside 2-deoxyribosyltransferase n=1 Tax=Caenimonas sedimenti TaxID=2596921 RepID=UPI001C95B482|nr:nucleoside 2-deoxyribosyltransferase [Caenimonas sedimenti]